MSCVVRVSTRLFSLFLGGKGGGEAPTIVTTHVVMPVSWNVIFELVSHPKNTIFLLFLKPFQRRREKLQHDWKRFPQLLAVLILGEWVTFLWVTLKIVFSELWNPPRMAIAEPRTTSQWAWAQLALFDHGVIMDLETSRGGGVSPPHSSLVGISANFSKFHRGSSHRKKIKILWRRKWVRRGIFRNVEVRVEDRFVPFNSYFVCKTAIGSLCDDFYRKSHDFTIKNR